MPHHRFPHALAVAFAALAAAAAAQPYPAELPPRVVRTPPALAFAPADAPGDPGRLIDVLVLWTPAAEAGAGGAASMPALVDAAIAATNLVYRNSGVAQRVRRVHAQAVAYDERLGPCQDPTGGGIAFEAILCALYDLTGAADGLLDEAHALRDAHGADLVALLVQDPTYCGVAWLPQPPAPSTAHLGFAVIAHDCAVGNLSFAHELAHAMGAHHDPYVLPAGGCADGRESGAWCFSRGRVNVALGWRTVMSYNAECLASGTTCTRVPYLSNPLLALGGAALGDPLAANNAHTLNRTAKTIAGYRPTSPLHPLPQRFGDVPASHPFHGHVEFLAQAGISDGCASGLFCPDRPATRAEIAVFLERAKRASNWVPPSPTGLFTDVTPSHVFGGHIEALARDGITQGCTATTYCPDAPVTRAQLAVLLLRARCGAAYAPAAPASAPFADVAPSHPFHAFIAKLHDLGITQGCAVAPLRFCPDDAATRAQAAAMLERSHPFLAPTEACAP